MQNKAQHVALYNHTICQPGSITQRASVDLRGVLSGRVSVQLDVRHVR